METITYKLEHFEGPLDLLLHLIEKNKVDIYDIPIVEITAQYLEYVRNMEREDLNLVSEFLVMAATLLDIKAKMLLPKEINEEGEEEDPRQELVEQLLFLARGDNDSMRIEMEDFDLTALAAEVLRETSVMVISDEIYAELTYGQHHVSIANIPGMYEHTIVVNGFSKAYSMTGWRLGYLCAPPEIVQQMTKLHQFGIMSAPTTSQYAAIEAMRNGDKDIEAMRDEYDGRRRYLVENLRRIGLSCFEPKGAFYVFPDIRSTGLSSEEFCERFLMEEKVAVIPGSAFGASGEGHIRISYSYSMSHLREACSRMKIFLENLKQEQK